MQQVNEIQGYGLFNDVEELELRVYNRARVMKNILLDHSDAQRNVNFKGMGLVITYQQAIPQEERKAVHDKLTELLQVKEAE